MKGGGRVGGRAIKKEKRKRTEEKEENERKNWIRYDINYRYVFGNSSLPTF